ncbi:hypothetical protein GCM10009760_32280 [Kitasatospora kazusensis]|uniref:Uncharacterized protein n=1 Tax=Kitasatospora kazusensis TaxID=407974 RepID=A0ABP5LG17_9ACTN
MHHVQGVGGLDDADAEGVQLPPQLGDLDLVAASGERGGQRETADAAAVDQDAQG